MKIKMLGGASGIGGAATLVESRNHTNFLFEFGMIMKGDGNGDRKKIRSGSNSLTARNEVKTADLLKEKNVKYLFISHTHLDHAGGVGEFLKEHPETKVVITRATFLQLQILMKDIYGKEEIDVMLPESRFEFVAPGIPKDLGDEIQVIPWPNGHLRGSCSFVLIIEGKVLVFSGDIADFDLPTVSGFNLIRLTNYLSSYPKPILFSESTYGNQVFPSRDEEEKRAISRIKDIIRRGGNILIPAFSLGRSTDVSAILSRNGIDHYIDGMAVACDRLLRQNLLYGNDKSVRLNEHVRYILDDAAREEVLFGRSRVVISSSGWLIGGKSMLYLQWLKCTKNAVLFFGPFQKYLAAEILKPDINEITIENPLRPMKLRKLKRALSEAKRRRRRYKIMEIKSAMDSIPLTVTYQKKAVVEKFALGSHSDSNGIVKFARDLSPEKVFLVHGEQPVKEALRAKITAELNISTEIGFDGMEIEL